MHGKGCRSLMVISFNARESMHIRGADLGLRMMMIGEAAEEEEAQMKDLARFSLIHNFNSFKSLSDIEYIRPNGGFSPSIKGIAWST